MDRYQLVTNLLHLCVSNGLPKIQGLITELDVEDNVIVVAFAWDGFKEMVDVEVSKPIIEGKGKSDRLMLECELADARLVLVCPYIGVERLSLVQVSSNYERPKFTKCAGLGRAKKMKGLIKVVYGSYEDGGRRLNRWRSTSFSWIRWGIFPDLTVLKFSFSTSMNGKKFPHTFAFV